ncbi:MAG: DUF937 domain-containing protein [Terracoccus sp.]
MSSYDEILSQVPIGDIAGRLGVSEAEARRATEAALPALLGGLHANAADPAGAASLHSALADHQGGASTLADVDEADGRKIVGNIFGGQTDQVVSQLGGVGGGSQGALVQKLLPILAPMVLSWLAGRMGGGGGLGGLLGGVLGGAGSQNTPAPGGAVDDGPLFPGGQGAQAAPTQVPQATPAGGDNPLQDVLGSVLGGATSGSGGGVLGGLLGGLLGGGRR